MAVCPGTRTSALGRFADRALYTAGGRRIVKHGRGRTKAEAQRKRTEVMDTCSPGGIPMLSYSQAKGHDLRWDVMAADLVGLPGLNLGPLPYQGTLPVVLAFVSHQ
jgi:hypothetical protein